MANIVLLLVIIMLVFSVIGVTLFRDIVPMYFGNLSSCIFSIFNIYPIYPDIYLYYLAIVWKRKLRKSFFYLVTLGNIAVSCKSHQRQVLYVKLTSFTRKLSSFSSPAWFWIDRTIKNYFFEKFLNVFPPPPPPKKKKKID